MYLFYEAGIMHFNTFIDRLAFVHGSLIVCYHVIIIIIIIIIIQ